jgi:hypothetical protein
MELAERQRKMETDALDVQNRERARLSTLIVPTIAELRSLTWQQFEDEIARMFERLGYLV